MEATYLPGNIRNRIRDLLKRDGMTQAELAQHIGGSGSTLLAAERCKRRARLIEINPRYVDVTIWRWEKETGKKAKLVKNIGGEKNGQK